MAIRAGKLRHLITIQQPGTGRDACGGVLSNSWVDFATDVRASVEPLQGREFFATVQQGAELTTRFRLRYLPGVRPDMRIIHQGRVFLISAPPIDVNMLHRELHIMAVESTAANNDDED